MSDRFNATILNAHAKLATDAWPTLQAGQPLPPDQLKAMGDFIGGANYWSTHQAEFVPVGYVRQGDGFVPEGGSTGGAPGNWNVEMQPPMWGGERRSGDNGVPYCNPRAVTCVPITIPAGTSGVLTMSVAEYRSAPSAKQATLSRTAGDFSSALSFSQGNTAAPSVTVGGNVQAGETIYFNFRFWSFDLSAPSTDDTPQGVSYGGGWPS